MIIPDAAIEIEADTLKFDASIMKARIGVLELENKQLRAAVDSIPHIIGQVCSDLKVKIAADIESVIDIDRTGSDTDREYISGARTGRDIALALIEDLRLQAREDQ